MGIIKKLFIKEDDEQSSTVETSKKVPNKEISKTKFPDFQNQENQTQNSNSFETNKTSFTPTNTNFSDAHLNQAIEIYQKGFDSLNKPGYDFYEFFQAIMHGGFDNPQAYTMAFMMGNGMDKSITKEKLVEQSEYYISEINKVYNDYVAKGNSKKQELINQKTNDNQNLSNELTLLKEQMESLRIQIQDRESKLAAIGSNYEPRINEIDSKLAANTTAKTRIVQSIEQVKQGIINYVK